MTYIAPKSYKIRACGRRYSRQGEQLKGIDWLKIKCHTRALWKR